MPIRVFLTGFPGSGKSTIVKKVTEIVRKGGYKVGGIVTPDVRREGRRVGFLIKDVHSGKEEILASIYFKTGPMVGKYRVNVSNFERVAIPALEFALESCDLIVLDEIAPMEMKSKAFREILLRVLKSKKPVLAAVHRSLVKSYENLGKVIWVRRERVDEIVKNVVDLFKIYLQA